MALKLPMEIWLQIISFLPYEDTHTNLKYTNKRFRTIVSGITIRQLPLKLWEEVFEQLDDYFTLLNLSATCKTFRNLIRYSKSKKILATTFREPLISSSPLAHGTLIKFHPILLRDHIRVHKYLEALLTPATENFWNISPFGFFGFNINEHPTMSENITSPPVHSYRLESPRLRYFGVAVGKYRVIPKAITLGEVLLDIQHYIDLNGAGRLITATTRGRSNGGTKTFVGDILDECSILSGQKVDKFRKHGCIMRRLEPIAVALDEDDVGDGGWDEEERAEFNAELLAISMLGIDI